MATGFGSAFALPYTPLAQSVRASVLYTVGCRFESDGAHQCTYVGGQALKGTKTIGVPYVGRKVPFVVSWSES